MASDLEEQKKLILPIMQVCGFTSKCSALADTSMGQLHARFVPATESSGDSASGPEGGILLPHVRC